MTHPACLPVDKLLEQVEVERVRGGGPGGQHRNRNATAVRLTHKPTGITAWAQERRSQELNRKQALQRLRVHLAVEHRQPMTLEGYWPSPLWKGRVRKMRIAVNPGHEDFPALLAEALDLLEACEDDVERVALVLGLTNSQLVKFLALAPIALSALNERRKAAGRRPFRT